MNPIHDLTRRLGEADPEWSGASLLPLRERHPLVLAGILTYRRLAPYYTCTACDADCPGVLDCFERNPEGPTRAYAAHCLRSGELITVSAWNLTVFGYDFRRLAELVATALDCTDELQTPRAGLYLLGKSAKCIGKVKRQICLMNHLDSLTDPHLQAHLPQNTSYLRFLGHGTAKANCTNPQLKRRIFMFNDVFGLQPDGTLDINLALIAEELDQSLLRDERPRRSGGQLKMERAFTQYLHEVAVSLLQARNADEREKIRKACFTYAAISAKTQISKSALSKYFLGKHATIETTAPWYIWHCVCQDENGFDTLKDYAAGLRCPLARMNPETAAGGLLEQMQRNAIRPSGVPACPPCGATRGRD